MRSEGFKLDTTGALAVNDLRRFRYGDEKKPIKEKISKITPPNQENPPVELLIGLTQKQRITRDRIALAIIPLIEKNTDIQNRLRPILLALLKININSNVPEFIDLLLQDDAFNGINRLKQIKNDLAQFRAQMAGRRTWNKELFNQVFPDQSDKPFESLAA